MCGPQRRGACREASLLGPPGRRAEAPASPGRCGPRPAGRGRRAPRPTKATKACSLQSSSPFPPAPESSLSGRHSPATSPEKDEAAVTTPLISIFLEVALPEEGSPCAQQMAGFPQLSQGYPLPAAPPTVPPPTPAAKGQRAIQKRKLRPPLWPTCPPSPRLPPPKLGFFSEPEHELARAYSRASYKGWLGVCCWGCGHTLLTRKAPWAVGPPAALSLCPVSVFS